MSLHTKFVVLSLFALAAYLGAISRGKPALADRRIFSVSLLTGMIWPRWLMQRLAVSRHSPHKAIEGETVVFQVNVENGGWLPRKDVERQQRGDRQASGTSFGQDQSTMSTAGALLPGSRWPTPKEMRAAATQPHMPGSQAAAIMRAADLSESLQQKLKSVVTRVIDPWGH